MPTASSISQAARAMLLALLAAGLAHAQPAPQLLRSYGSGGGGLGWAVADMPDLDGDGRRDFIAGANGAGRVVAYSSARATALWSATPGVASLGCSLSSAGDVDGDGVADVIAGAPEAAGGGAALLLSGVDGAVLRTLPRPAGAAAFGYAVSRVDDLDGDGVLDLLVGAPASSQVYLLGAADGRVLRMHAGSPGSELGAGVAQLADLDGDGIADYVAGAPADGTGRAYVYSGASGAQLRRLEAQASGRFGEFFVADAGDLDADGVTDVYVGAYAESNNNGAAYGFSGSSGARLFRIGGAPGEGLGPGRGVGDVNGDGHADLVIGGYTYSGGGLGQGGRASVFSGADQQVLMRIDGFRTGGQFGFDAVGLGDVDGDGRLDFIVASSPANRVDLYSGVIARPLLPANALPNRSHTWWNPAEPGWGFDVLEQGALVYATWYTYAEDGRPMFLTVQATRQPDGSHAGPVYRVAGTPFAQIANAQAFTSVTELGSAQLRFESSGELLLDYTVQGFTQRKRLQRFVFAAAPSCYGSSLARAQLANYSDLWWNPREAGWGLTLAHQGNTIFALWYTYGVGGRDQWLSATLTRGADGSFSGALQRPANGTPLAAIGGPATSFPVPAVGTARLRFSAGEHGIFEYSLEGVSQRKRIQRFVAAPGNQPRPHCVTAAGSDAIPSPTVSTEFVPTRFIEQGAPVQLEMVIHKPAGRGPFPTLLFNHGSTGQGNDPTLYTRTWTHPVAARFFNERGWMVVFPQRRGRGRSGGSYAEGLAADGSGYSCNTGIALAGMERALADIDEVVLHLQARSDVDARRLLVAGQSRGGILAIVHAGTRPAVFTGALNFVGGWMSDGCSTVATINTASFRRGAAFAGPTAWLYGENDPFYRLSHSQANFAAFRESGGHGEFVAYTLGPGISGHSVINFPERWGAAAERLLDQLPLPAGG